MANTLYPKFKENLLQGSYNLLTQAVKCMLIKSGYSYSASHQYVSHIVSYDNGRSSALTGKTVTDGVFDANDINITCASASQVIAFVLYIDTGSDNTSPLIAFIDEADGLPFSLSAGGQVSVIWDDGPYRIFSL